MEQSKKDPWRLGPPQEAGISPPGRREALAEYRGLLTKAEPSARDMKRLKVLLGRFGKALQDATRDRKLLRQLRDLQNRASQPAGAERALSKVPLASESAGHRADSEQIRQLLGDAEFDRLGEEKARQLITDLFD